MNILITGCSGFLGINLIAEIRKLRNNWNIFGIDKTEPSMKEICFFKINLLKNKSWKPFLDEINPDIIFHLAGIYHDRDKKTMLEINTNQFLYLLDDVIGCDLNPKIIIIGSAAQYGKIKEDENPLKEDYPQKPLSVYGLSKKWQEEIGLFYHNQYGLNIICTRISNMIGKNISQKLLPGYLTKLFSESNNEINIKISNKYSQRDYIDVRDVSEALIKLVKEKSCIGNIFNISSSESISNENLINMFSQISKKKVKIKEFDKNNISKISLANDKIKNKINWDIRFNLLESIKWCLEH